MSAYRSAYRRPKPKTPAQLQKQCDDWNARYPVGTEVEYYPVMGDTQYSVHRTRMPAQVLSGHTAVIWIEEKAGCVSLDHVSVILKPDEVNEPRDPRRELWVQWDLLLGQAAIIAEMPIEKWLDDFDRAETLGPILDPTLYRSYLYSKKGDVLKAVFNAALTLKRAVLEARERVDRETGEVKR